MSIPDNPFSTDSSPQSQRISSPSSAPPRHTDTASSSPIVAPVPIREDSSRLETKTPSPARTPGGSVLQPPGIRPDRPPRHVQFNNQSHVVSLAPLRPEAPGTPDQTVNNSNIAQLDTALERHRTTQRRRTPRELTISTESSADGLTDGEDYDYRLDVDPPGAGPQSPVSGDGPMREGNTLQNILGRPGDTWVPREYIPLGETDGLPSQIPGQEARDERNEAKDLVRVHTSKWGTLRRRVRGAGSISRVLEGEGKHRMFQSSPTGPAGDPIRTGESEKSPVGRVRSPLRETGPNIPDGLQDAPGMIRRQSGGLPPLPGGGGTSVLSSLLQLYNQSNVPQSTATSATSSRASSEDEYSSDDSHPKKPVDGNPTPSSELGIDRIISPDHGEAGIIRQPIETVAADDIRPEIPRDPVPPPNTSSSSFVGRNSGRTTPSGSGVLGYFRKAKDEVMEKIEDCDRPEAARSGAGVFGALLQSTANVSGVATPAASALAPAARRSGFQLNRFAIPEGDGPLVTPRHWRPPSYPSSKNGSRPPSVHSSTAVSNTNSFEEKKRSRSNSDPLQNASKGTGSKKTKPFDAHALGKLPGATMIGQGGAAIKSAEKWIASKTPLTTPPSEMLGDYMTRQLSRPLTEEERRRKEWEREYRKKKRAKKARKKQEVFIIQHVAAVLARQQFLLKLARALMMFGSPSHRLETQIQATARVLELNCQVVYLPGLMLVSFNDEATHTSETKFLKQSTGIDLGKLLATHNIYWYVIHDRCSVDEASKHLDVLMTSRPYYNAWQTIAIGATCSAFISVISYHGSFIDALMSMPLGALLVIVQMLAVKNDLFSNVFEIAIATLISFLSAALASTGRFCYTALVSGGVVLILPGYIVLTGALELASRNIISGSVRIGYSVIYSLFLGFGISIGAEFWIKFTGHDIKGTADYGCGDAHANAPWYQVTPSPYWWFLCCPGFAITLALRNQQPILAKELPVMTIIAAAGWCSNHFAAIAFPNRSDMTSAIGAFVVGTLGNIYGRFSHGASFPVTVIGILFQLPSGLANGGIFNFAQESTSGTGNAYSDGFQVAEQLVSVAIGLTVGLFVSAVVTNPLGGGRRTGSGIFAF